MCVCFRSPCVVHPQVPRSTPTTLCSTLTTLCSTLTTLCSIPTTLCSTSTTLWGTPTSLWNFPTTLWVRRGWAYPAPGVWGTAIAGVVAVPEDQRVRCPGGGQTALCTCPPTGGRGQTANPRRSLNTGEGVGRGGGVAPNGRRGPLCMETRHTQIRWRMGSTGYSVAPNPKGASPCKESGQRPGSMPGRGSRVWSRYWLRRTPTTVPALTCTAQGDHKS